ncbi:adenosylcobalamin-dependent ribonucleoside-diphosphate reductase (plasmid) [Haloferax mediterranei ATCC 33500]|uniref:Vitamin B12-dependent ribonucleotide reductase n=1 Tax=Haloferax mediterranei (strain ATCC 33500 / DSM 1411 / JCM 8866 / NBRC 14739 / NCIMB 2177 / R-4) TaxID=523841 RepID=I3RA81_HALMT|nr:adenosylcobalamin-dependent ribonucleoside-diphosphate reductase [Haloferax mediterranei]AFK21141.1 ribonucleoside-diphosphate reductase alpha chain [Haloferax mediterranei ATCC 33500]AHZ24335.1 ribonucleoside-diphosphate reductase [Haloferax mediterranei ATCC 33500]ELZ97069.1 ribonucleotide-diphosphate reductase subunit alpha [Haloferax mediterranei ATCC 33500]MDX5990184.1 adenosylcobalamin-dependent ribonucleoside-diphosphate reductase [Haloferax mediterranei ATCC 33500]QCQ76743.1 adenosy
MGSLDSVAKTVLHRRYLRQDKEGNVVETPDEMFHRVAANLAAAESQFGGDVETTEAQFYEVMSNLDFLPNSPTLMNAGTELQQLAACFVLPIEDSIESIFTAVKQTALIHQSGGGTGFSFSNLRPEGDVVLKTGGVASGPVSFMKVFDTATEQIKQGGRRRGANMSVLDITHPDIEEFITIKAEEDVLRNFNLSVATGEAFWDAYESEETYDIVNPRTGETVRQADPDAMLSQTAEMAWETGDPGILFLDTINEQNPISELGKIEATNPCGEVPELPYEACILGSINLGQHTDNGDVDWEKLRTTVHLAVRFLDNAIEMSEFPVPEIEEMVTKTRRLGLGVMGFHDMLVDLRIPYYSEDAVEFAEELMGFIHDEAWKASKQLANERDPFPAWENSSYEEPVRNVTTTTIAPTGTISLIAGSSASIEPIYSVVYTKQVMGGLEVVNDRFVDIAKKREFYSADLVEKLHGRTTIQDVEAVPDDVKRLFQTAHDVPADHHLKVQAAFQRHVDNAVSKTVNLPQSASVDDIKEIFLSARDLGLKGVTVFRSGAKPEQVLGESPLKEECVGECDYVSPR